MGRTLERKRRDKSYRSLLLYSEKSGTEPKRNSMSPNIDFSSNDYLGIAHCPKQRIKVDEEYRNLIESGQASLGATGSRYETNRFFMSCLSGIIAQFQNLNSSWFMTG